MSGDEKEAALEVIPEAYSDLAKPVAKEVGKLIALPLRAVNAVLGSLYAKVHRAELIQQLVEDRLTQDFAERPDDLTLPPPHVALPAMQALVYSAEETELREMYLRLISTSADATKSGVAHPAYVDIIRQLTKDEAKILSLYGSTWEIDTWQVEVHRHVKPPDRAGWIDRSRVHKRLTLLAKDTQLDFPEAVPKAIDNLLRQRLIYETRKFAHHISKCEQIGVPHKSNYPTEEFYYYGGRRFGELCEANPFIVASMGEFSGYPDALQVWDSHLRLTSFGGDFFRACIGAKPAPAPPDAAEHLMAEEAL